MRVLASVTNKAGLANFLKQVSEIFPGSEFVSSGGTAKMLRDEGVAPVIDVSDVTGFPECLNGRVKTLHPNIHAGILATKKPEHEQFLKEHGIKRFDMIVVNLYDFEGILSRPNLCLEDAIEEIDIGGPTLIRAAAKNYDCVIPVCDPRDYKWILDDFRNTGNLNERKRLYLAKKVFKRTHEYDGVISGYLEAKIEEYF